MFGGIRRDAAVSGSRQRSRQLCQAASRECASTQTICITRWLDWWGRFEERRLCTAEVRGSNPLGSTVRAGNSYKLHCLQKEQRDVSSATSRRSTVSTL